MKFTGHVYFRRSVTPYTGRLTLLTAITNMNVGKREYTFSNRDIIFICTNMMKEYQKRGNISSILVFQLLKVEMHCIHSNFLQC